MNVKTVDINTGELFNAKICKMAGNENVLSMLKEMQLLTNQMRHGKLNEMQLRRFGELNDILKSDCLEDFETKGNFISTFDDIPEDVFPLAQI
jgi:hypothetical protein